MEKNKVFYTDIIRTEDCHHNDLYELLKVVPAKPVILKEKEKPKCDFIPRTDKIYIPKRIPMEKVKTVRDIRSAFEDATHTYLSKDLESQQNYLLKKIRAGSARNEVTLNIAKKMLKSDTPISKSTWQMLVNLNPDHNLHPQQFVIWNGKSIQVNGSIGGNKKVIYNFDLTNTKLTSQVKETVLKKNISYKSKGLLRNSLSIKFKPGPLRRKKFLDDSHQKYNGDIELVDLPKVGLVIQPTYDTSLDPKITQFLSNMREEDGTISQKWAEFAVSVLGKIEKSNAILLTSECVSFDLKYKCGQDRILVRRDLDSSTSIPRITNAQTERTNIIKGQPDILPEIEEMMSKIIDAVEININQDTMFTADEDMKQDTIEDANTIDTTIPTKEKGKRKYLELDRLDVTVIRLPENCQKDSVQDCGNLYCSLGCVCDSLKVKYNFKQHCGREDCMFDCKCDFSKYTSISSGLASSDSAYLIPGIINIEDEINMRLAKEEQKFHQTVIVTGEKNILFKSERRNWKSSKKYESFYKNMCLKNVNQRKRKLSIPLLKLNCENIQPWCMVHNLYKCFCKGKFKESTLTHVPEKPVKEPVSKEASPVSELTPNIMQKSTITDVLLTRKQGFEIKQGLRNRRSNAGSSGKIMKTNTIARQNLNSGLTAEKNLTTLTGSNLIIDEDIALLETSDAFNLYNSKRSGKCSRVIPYRGRKYSDTHYKNTNYKIQEMEKNDKNLHQRMMSILQESDMDNILANDNEENDDTINVNDTKTLNTLRKEQDFIKETENYIIETTNTEMNKDSNVQYCDDPNLDEFLYDINDITSDCNNTNSLPYVNKLVGWLESNYKLHKNRIDQGLIKQSLEAPKIGKVALHSWDFILSRYKERKNLFLISKQKPYRMFMGVHTRSSFFESCMNINEIRFADLHKYPQTVKNLLTNATDLKDNFCILRGLAHCWELVGSVAKVRQKDDIEEIHSENSDIESNPLSQPMDISDEQLSVSGSERTDIEMPCSQEDETSEEPPEETGSSKWFVMTVENDFSEIRFYKKGFFVKYESIINSINVARLSTQTVRLSSQKCADSKSDPQFGIYAIPNASEYCVFIGPYEMQDSLGIETMKSIFDDRKCNKTRGFWMYTNKVDNLKVIDNPMSFIPSFTSNSENNEVVPLENHLFEDKNSSDGIDKEPPEEVSTTKPNEIQSNSLLKLKKQVKPIKIRKTNKFYHLSPENLFKKIPLQSPHKLSARGPVLTPSSTIGSHMIARSLFTDARPSSNTITSENIMSSPPKLSKTEEVPQIKISAVYSQKVEELNSNKTEKGMFILKPEEINRKLFEVQCNSEAISPSQNDEDISGSEQDSEEFEQFSIQPSVTRCTFDDDVCVISDDDDDLVKDNETPWRDVLIQCTNVNVLGWIWGRRMSNSSLLSIRVPGDDQYTKFYTEKKAFQTLNSDLSKVIGASKPFNFDWTVVELTNDFEGDINPLDLDSLRQALAEEGESSKAPMTVDLLVRHPMKTYSRKNNTSTLCASPSPSTEST